MEFMRWGTGCTQWLKAHVLQAEVCWQKIHGILFKSVSPPEQRAMLERFWVNMSSLVEYITHVPYSSLVCA